MAEEQLFYRFRTLKHIFEYKELENQEIYFASPEELNDPMEAYKETIFQGDIVIWKNLYRHYIACFFKEYLRFYFNEEKSMNDVDVKYNIDYSTYGSFNNLKDLKNNYDKICNEFLEYFNEEIKYISENKNINKNDLIYYLHFFNDIILQIIDFEISYYSKEKYNDLYKSKNNAKHLFNLLIKSELNTKIKTYSNSLHNYYINMENITYLKFTEEYVNCLIKHFYPYEYIASFSTKYDNHVVWSHYTNNHEGICMIYKNDIKFLNKLDKNTIFDNKLYKVKYTNNIKTSSFFKDMYYKEYKEYMDFWHLDTNGKKSALYRKKDLSYKDSINYKNLFDKYTKKSFIFSMQKLEHWKDENEYRLIMLSYYYQLDKNYKVMKYDFNSLNGIIFGIKTPMTDKLKIIEIIQKLCNQHKRKEFNFYQAYTNKKGEICKEPLYIQLNTYDADKGKEYKEYSNFI